MKALLRWVLAVYIVFLGSEEYFTGPGPVYKIAAVLFILFFLVFAFGRVKIRFSHVSVAMILFGAFAVTSSTWSVDTTHAMTYTFILIQLLFTTWITSVCIENEADIRLMIWCLLLASVFPCIGILHDYLTGNTSWTLGYLNRPLKDYGERATFGDADPNLLAFRFGVSVLAAIYLAFRSRERWHGVLLFILASVFTATSLLTGSRGGVLALSLGVIVLLLNDIKMKKGAVLGAIAGLVLIVSISLPMLPSSVSSRYFGMREEVSAGSMAGRKDIYREGWSSFKKRPLLGVGFYCFQKNNSFGLLAHNDLFEILMDMGILGLVVYLVFLAALFKNVIDVPPPWRALAAGLFAAYLVAGSSIALLTVKLPWVLFGIIIGASRCRGVLAQPSIDYNMVVPEKSVRLNV